MKQQPTLQTQRLVLRPFNSTDVKQLQQLASAYEIAATTLSIPHPYPDNLAQQWIERYLVEFVEGTGVTFAIVIRAQEVLSGMILLKITAIHANAELGYWIGVPYWGQGYCTEAAIAIMEYGFFKLELNRIYATHFKNNLASGRIVPIKTGDSLLVPPTGTHLIKNTGSSRLYTLTLMVTNENFSQLIRSGISVELDAEDMAVLERISK